MAAHSFPSTIEVVMFTALLSLLVILGPPWITIEYPGNPYDQATRNAYLVVHTYHHMAPVFADLRGEAVTWEGGHRKATPLRFGETGRTGAYTLERQWSTGRPTVLVITYGGEHGTVTALVSVSAEGVVTRVDVPSRPYENIVVPRDPTPADEIAALRAAGGSA